jgi:hypothetical protein
MNILDDRRMVKEINDRAAVGMAIVRNVFKENKAGFDPSQQRNPDGTWGHQAAPAEPGDVSGDPEPLSNWSALNPEDQMKIHYSDPEMQGSTFDPITGANLAGTKNSFAVAISDQLTWNPETVGENLTSENLTAYVNNNKSIFTQGGTAVGSWYGADQGDPKELWLDVITIVKGKEKAVQLGRDNNQVAIWDLENGVEINTGGSGKWKLITMETKNSKKYQENYYNFMKRVHSKKKKKPTDNKTKK